MSATPYTPPAGYLHDGEGGFVASSDCPEMPELTELEPLEMAGGVFLTWWVVGLILLGSFVASFLGAALAVTLSD